MTREELLYYLRSWHRIEDCSQDYHDIFDLTYCLPRIEELKGGEGVSLYNTVGALGLAHLLSELSDAILDNVDWDSVNNEEDIGYGFGALELKPVYFRRKDD